MADSVGAGADVGTGAVVGAEFDVGESGWASPGDGELSAPLANARAIIALLRAANFMRTSYSTAVTKK